MKLVSFSSCVIPAIAREDSIQVRVQRAVGNALAKVVRIRRVVWIGQGQGVDGPVIVLVPTYRADVLHHRDNRRRELPLHSEAEIRGPRRRIVVCQIGQSGGKGLRRCELPSRRWCSGWRSKRWWRWVCRQRVDSRQRCIHRCPEHAQRTFQSHRGPPSFHLR